MASSQPVAEQPAMDMLAKDSAEPAPTEKTPAERDPSERDSAEKDSAVDDPPLEKVDSAVQGLDLTSLRKRRASSSADSKVPRLEDLGEEEVLKLADETQQTGWKINTSPSTVSDPAILKKFLTTPPLRKIELHFPTSIVLYARNLKGITIKDALDAIHKQFKKKAEDEIDLPYLKGFEWNPDPSERSFLTVHLQKEGKPTSSKKKKSKDAEEA